LITIATLITIRLRSKGYTVRMEFV